MKTLYCIGGESATGKTTLRTTGDFLSNLPYVDLREIRSAHPKLVPGAVFSVALRCVEVFLSDSPAVVLEAYFRPESFQRIQVVRFSQRLEVKIEWRYLTATFAELVDRIEKQFRSGGDFEFYQRRLAMLSQAKKSGLID